jgi:hypothetical protein
MLKSWCTRAEEAIFTVTREGGNRLVEAVGSEDSSHDGYDTLILLKPEIATPVFGRRIDLVLYAVFDGLARAGVAIKRVCAWSGKALHQRNIFPQLYGQLHRVAVSGPSLLSWTARTNLRSITYQAEVAVEGAFYSLSDCHYVNAARLEKKARGAGIIKLGHNSYASTLEIGGKRRVILNSFWPGLLEHLSAPTSVVLAMQCHTHHSPQFLREKIIGNTDPNLALDHTIRSRLAREHKSLGIDMPTIGRNGIHCSPGIVEAIFGIKCFFESSEPRLQFTFERKLLRAGIPRSWFSGFNDNPEIKWNGARERIFEVTENLDAEQTLRALLRVWQSSRIESQLASQAEVSP